ncbi:MAG: restriction endonuclease [Candidatus Zixiibacteriota bacterium]
MLKVFISHPFHERRNEEIVKELSRLLEYFDAVVTSSSDGALIGLNWQNNIVNLINDCAIIICFAAQEEPNMMFELGYALAKNKYIIIIGNLKDLPSEFRNLSYLPAASTPYDILLHVEKYIINKNNNDFIKDKSNSIDKYSIEKLLDRPELLDYLDNSQFNELIMDWFRKKDYNIEHTFIGDDDSRIKQDNKFIILGAKSELYYGIHTYRYGDEGYDFCIYPFKSKKAIVNVKKYNYKTKVPLSAINDLSKTMLREGVDYGIIVSTVPYSSSAIDFMLNTSSNIMLWTLKDLNRMKYYRKEQVETTYFGEFSIPINEKFGRN